MGGEATSLTAPVHRLDVVFSGCVVAAVARPGGARALRISTAVLSRASGSLAARRVGWHRAWRTTMPGGLVWLGTLATRDSPERHAAIAGVFAETIAEVRRKQAGHPAGAGGRAARGRHARSPGRETG